MALHVPQVAAQLQLCTNFEDDNGNSASAKVAGRDFSVLEVDLNGLSRRQCFANVAGGDDAQTPTCFVGACQPAFNLTITQCAILTRVQEDIDHGSGVPTKPTTLFVFGAVNGGTFCMPCTEPAVAGVDSFPEDPSMRMSFLFAALLGAGVVSPDVSDASHRVFVVQDMLAIDEGGDYVNADVCGEAEYPSSCGNSGFSAWTEWTSCDGGTEVKTRTFLPATDVTDYDGGLSGPFVQFLATNVTQVCHCCSEDTPIVQLWNTTHGNQTFFADFEEEYPYYMQVQTESCDDDEIIAPAGVAIWISGREICADFEHLNPLTDPQSCTASNLEVPNNPEKYTEYNETNVAGCYLRDGSPPQLWFNSAFGSLARPDNPADIVCVAARGGNTRVFRLRWLHAFFA